MSDSLVVVIEEMAKNIEVIKYAVVGACIFLGGIYALILIRFWRD